MNVLVVGGSGFIGTRLVSDLLSKNHSVRIFDKAQSDKYPDLVTIGDVREEAALTDACQNIDTIYNLAAEHADDVTPISLYADVNIGGANNIVAAAKANGVKRIVFTSSVAIYGLNRGEPDESMKAHPFNEYGRTKYEAEKIYLAWAKESSESTLIIVRPSVIFGEDNRGNVYNLIHQIHIARFLMVGDGQNRKSMGYVGNIAVFLSEQTSAEPGIHIFNFAGKPDLSSKEVVDIITDELGLAKTIPSVPYWLGLAAGYTFDILAKLTGKKFPVSSVRIRKFCAGTTVNTNRLLASGFRAPYTLEEGLRKMIRHEYE